MNKAMVDIEVAVAIRKLVEALKIRAPAGGFGFTCPECGSELVVHINPEQPNRFEHKAQGKACSLRAN